MRKDDFSKFCVIVSGPTGVGKTEFVYALAEKVNNVEIINGDMGQLYTPLNIGTAKPCWKRSKIQHHLFDVLDNPMLFSSSAYRDRVATICSSVWHNNNIPIIVGGSLFYIASLLFPPRQYNNLEKVPITFPQESRLWETLNAIDPIRASAIGFRDTYRLKRALEIWQITGKKPSEYKSIYNPIAPFIFVWVSRDRDCLYKRINERVESMMTHGLIQEVIDLLDSEWEAFLLGKKIIGYPEIIAVCRGKMSKEDAIAIIQQKTRAYAKRQLSFWRMLSKKLQENFGANNSPSFIFEANLTHEPLARYIRQLQSAIDKK